jgi:hypothetical protein
MRRSVEGGWKRAGKSVPRWSPILPHVQFGKGRMEKGRVIDTSPAAYFTTRFFFQVLFFQEVINICKFSIRANSSLFHSADDWKT